MWRWHGKCRSTTTGSSCPSSQISAELLEGTDHSLSNSPSEGVPPATLLIGQKRSTGKCQICLPRRVQKVNSLRRIPRFVIALHSPNALVETGLLMCASEKNWDSDGLRCRAVHYLQSGLWTKYCEIRAWFTYFGGESGGISLQSRLAGGASRIRTRATVLNSATPDVCVTCRRCST